MLTAKRLCDRTGRGEAKGGSTMLDPTMVDPMCYQVQKMT